MRFSIYRVLLKKEFARLSRNLSAMLVLGLMLVVTLLLVTSKEQTDKEQTADSATELSSCRLVYREEDDWIRFLKHRAAATDVPFYSGETLPIVPIDGIPVINGQRDYGINSCVVEIRKMAGQTTGESDVYRLVYRYSGDDKSRFFPVVNWLLINSTWHSGGKVRIETGSRPIETPRKKNTHKSRAPGLSVDEDDRISLVCTMLLFTVQFFVCCALFVSFTSQEKEQGVLQAIALSPARMSEIILAKFSFHLMIALIFSALIVFLVNRATLAIPGFWITTVLSCLGLVAIGAIISSIARTQTTAGLMVFGYILLNGVVIMLSKQFEVFMTLQAFMFEYYSFIFTFLSLGDRPEQLFVALYAGLGRMTAIVTVLLIVSVVLFRKYGWQSR